MYIYLFNYQKINLDSNNFLSDFHRKSVTKKILMFINSDIVNSSMLIVFFLGLGLLIISDLMGFLLFKSSSKNVFFSVFLGLLVILSFYAIIKSRFNSVGLLVILWLIGYEFFIKKEQLLIPFNFKKTIYRQLTISCVWILIFALKSSCFWNESSKTI